MLFSRNEIKLKKNLICLTGYFSEMGKCCETESPIFGNAYFVKTRNLCFVLSVFHDFFLISQKSINEPNSWKIEGNGNTRNPTNGTVT